MAVYDDRSTESPVTSSRSVTETVNGSHKFVIQGYSLAKGMGSGKYLRSESFSVGDYQWAIYFYPDGKNPNNNATYVSAFIVLGSEGTDVRALFELTLVDQSGNGKHRVHGHFNRSLDSGPYTLKCYRSMWGYKRYFRRALLETSDYLKDDTLIINCTVGVVVSKVDMLEHSSIKVLESGTGSEFGKLLDNMEESDITFNVSSEKFHAHKLVLAARSPIFQSKFLDEHGENDTEILITDMEPRIFKAMLHFIYRDNLIEEEDPQSSSSSESSSDHFTAQLLAVANTYGLDRLKLICESRICKRISVDSVAEILMLANRCNASELKAACLRFSVENLKAVLRTEGFMHLKENFPLLQSELLKTIAGFYDGKDIGDGGTQSVLAQISIGEDRINWRRVRQKIMR